jgi:hypothetical protein
MSRVFMTALFSMAVLSGCGKKGGANAAMEKFKSHVEKICACKDTDCVTKATETYSKEMADWAKENAGKTAEAPSEADKKAMEDATKKMTECTTKLATDAAKKAGAGSDDAKKDEPKKDEPKKDEPKKDEPTKDEPKKDEAKAGEDTELQKKGLEVMSKMGDIMVANEKDCKKMGEELKKLIADNKATLDELDAWEKKDAAGKKAFEDRHKADMESWMKKVEKPITACSKDKGVEEAMKALAN